MTEGRTKPPICPWRLEVADTGQGARTPFLHVFEITDEQASKPTAVKLVGESGVDIGQKWKVRFGATGEPGGTVNARPLATTLLTDAQYKQSAATPAK
jgi:hypothetical protein